MDNKYLDKIKKTQLEILDYIIKICKDNKITYFLIGGTLLGAVRHKGYIPWDDDIDIGMPRNDYEKFIKVFKNNEKLILDYFTTNEHYWLPFIKVRNKNTIYRESAQINYKGNEGIWVDIFPLDNADKEKSFMEWFQFKATFALRTAISKKMNISVEKKNNIIKELTCKFLSKLPYKLLTKIQRNIMMQNRNNHSGYILNLASHYGYKKEVYLREKFFPQKELEFEGRKCNVPNDYDYVLKKLYGFNYMELPPLEKRINHKPVKIVFEDGKEITLN